MLTLDAFIAIAVILFLVTLIVLVCMVGKLLFDTTGSTHGETVYILRVSSKGDVRIKRYRGRVKYWNDIDV